MIPRRLRCILTEELHTETEDGTPLLHFCPGAVIDVFDENLAEALLATGAWEEQAIEGLTEAPAADGWLPALSSPEPPPPPGPELSEEEDSNAEGVEVLRAEGDGSEG